MALRPSGLTIDYVGEVAPVSRFHAYPGALAGWVGLHTVLWTVIGLAFGFAEFTRVWQVMFFGAWVGVVHAVVQWATTSVNSACAMRAAALPFGLPGKYRFRSRRSGR